MTTIARPAETQPVWTSPGCSPLPSRDRPLSAPKQGIVLSVTSIKGGVGKTAVAWKFATMLTNLNRTDEASVLLVETSLCSPVRDTVVERSKHGNGFSVDWRNIWEKGGDLLQTVRDNAVSLPIHGENVGVDMVRCWDLGYISDLDTLGYLTDLLEVASSLYDFVIVDYPITNRTSNPKMLSQVLLPASDHVVWLMDSTATTVKNTLATLKLLRKDPMTRSASAVGIHLLQNKKTSGDKNMTRHLKRQAKRSDTDFKWNFAGTIPYDSHYPKKWEIKADHYRDEIYIKATPDITQTQFSAMLAMASAPPEAKLFRNPPGLGIVPLGGSERSVLKILSRILGMSVSELKVRTGRK